MKKLILVFLVLIPLMIKAQPVTQDMPPDSTWMYSDNKPDWSPYGTVLYNYNDTVFCCIVAANNPGEYELAHIVNPYFYTFNKEHYNKKPNKLSPVAFSPLKNNSITNYGYPGETSATTFPQVQGKAFFFEFNGRLWFFHHLKAAKKDESYECYTYMDRLTNTNKVYFNQNDPVPDVIKQGAFQLDSLLFFIGINQNKASANYGLWCMQQYAYDTLSGKFIKGPDYYLHNIRNSPAFGGYIKRIDSLQQVSLLLDTYNPGTPQNYIGLLTHAKSATGYIFSYKTLDSVAYNSNTIGTIALASGSLKGQKTTDVQPTLSDRISYCMITSAKSSNGHYLMYYREFYISPANKLTVMYQGSVTLGNGPYPMAPLYSDSKTLFDMTCVAELIPRDWSTALDGNDAFQARTDFFYPDKNGNINAAEFYSDRFMHDGVTPVVSNDLYKSKKYPGIKGLWNLIGIIEGAPPCPTDWKVWDSTLIITLHDKAPTELFIKSENIQTLTTTATHDDQWSVGGSFEKLGLKDAEKASWIGSLGLKYMGAYQSEIKKSNTVTNTYEITFELSEEAQNSGVFVYTVPEISRFKYNAYPWWDALLQYPVRNTLQYLFRTTGMDIEYDTVPLNTYPYYINNANDPSMNDWQSDPVSQNSRWTITDQIWHYGKSSLAHLSWSSPVAGPDRAYSTDLGSSSKYTYTNGFSEESSIGSEVPEVFKLSVAESYEYSYSTSVESETNSGFEIEPSLGNLEIAAWGTKIHSLDMDVYFLHHDSTKVDGKWEQINWWYYDSLQGMRPWYLAYVVTGVDSKIMLLSPLDQMLLPHSGPLFTWKTEGEELSDYTVLVSKSASTSPSAIIYRQPAGDAHSLNPVGFVPETGKTYYWRVMARSGKGDVVWSSPRSFTVEKQQDSSTEDSPSKSVIYPNPGNPGEVKVAFGAEQAGIASCTVYSYGGASIYHEDFVAGGPGQVRTITVPSYVGAGVYVVEIICNGQRVMKKMVIL
jgi:hypothetical protein